MYNGDPYWGDEEPWPSGGVEMENKMTEEKEVYLGDGLYAKFDGYQLWLRTPRVGGDHMVALEPEVFDRFLAFVKQIGWKSNG